MNIKEKFQITSKLSRGKIDIHIENARKELRLAQKASEEAGVPFHARVYP